MAADRTFVFSLGGSLIAPNEINVAFLKKFRKLILAQAKKGRRFIIVCGGGGVNRMYNRAASKLANPSSTELDNLGISITYVNAFLVRLIFGNAAYSEVVQNPTRKVKTTKKILVGCGWKPGCSTDKDAVLLAKTFGAKRVVNLTNVDYAYDKDPRKHKDAKRIERISWHAFRKLFGDKWTPKLSTPFDPVAAKLAQRLKLKVIVAKGSNLKNLSRIIEGRPFKGTIIG